MVKDAPEKLGAARGTVFWGAFLPIEGTSLKGCQGGAREWEGPLSRSALLGEIPLLPV